MKRLPLLLGLTICAAGAALVAFLVQRDTSGDTGRGARELTFAHYNIHANLVQAYREVARDYEAAHPGVRIRLLAVPIRQWPAWRQARLIGDTAPEILQMGAGLSDELTARYMLPLTAHVEDPNPYNVGTSQAGVPWRLTFVDGLSSTPSYNAALLEIYGVPFFNLTSRLFFNRDLLRAITGSEEPPRDFTGLLQLQMRARAWSVRTGQPLTLIGGAPTELRPMLNNLVGSPSQQRQETIVADYAYGPTALDLGRGFLTGRWGVREPTLVAGLDLLARHRDLFSPGMLQMRRDEAVFQFTQGRTLMICSGSWDADTLPRQASFRVGVCDLPLPTPDDPVFGRGVLGRPVEADTGLIQPFGIARSAADPALALDFLRYLTSVPVQTRLTQASKHTSAVRGVPAAAGAEAFQPRHAGPAPGFNLEFFDLPEANRVYQTWLHELLGPQGSTERFLTALAEELPQALREDLARQGRVQAKQSRRTDVMLALLAARGTTDDTERAARLLEQQTFNDTHRSADLDLLQPAAPPAQP